MYARLIARPTEPKHAYDNQRTSPESLCQSQFRDMFPISLLHVSKVFALKEEANEYGQKGADENREECESCRSWLEAPELYELREGRGGLFFSQRRIP
jgi:hypothetical protein